MRQTTAATTGTTRETAARPADSFESERAALLRQLGPLGLLLDWLDRHPRTASALLWLMAAAAAWVVFTYDFTIPAYK